MFDLFRKQVYFGPGKRTILNPRWARNTQGRPVKPFGKRNKGYKPGIVKGFRDA